MIIKNLSIQGVKELLPKKMDDNRGYFFESFRSTYLPNFIVKQENTSFSLKKGTLRGIHLQLGIHAQAKLVSCIKGKILDVFVDLRKGSKTLGKWGSVVLDDKMNNQVFIPKHFGHGFLTLTKNCIVSYKIDQYYDKKSEYTILWSDKSLNIEWNDSVPIMSDKDKMGNSLKEYLSKITNL